MIFKRHNPGKCDCDCPCAIPIFEDDFNRANNTSLGADWDERLFQVAEIVSNEVEFKIDGTSVECAVVTSDQYTAFDPTNADQSVCALVKGTDTGGHKIGICVDYVGSSNASHALMWEPGPSGGGGSAKLRLYSVTQPATSLSKSLLATTTISSGPLSETGNSQVLLYLEVSGNVLHGWVELSGEKHTVTTTITRHGGERAAILAFDGATSSNSVFADEFKMCTRGIAGTGEGAGSGIVESPCTFCINDEWPAYMKMRLKNYPNSQHSRLGCCESFNGSYILPAFGDCAYRRIHELTAADACCGNSNGSIFGRHTHFIIFGRKPELHTGLPITHYTITATFLEECWSPTGSGKFFTFVAFHRAAWYKEFPVAGGKLDCLNFANLKLPLVQHSAGSGACPSPFLPPSDELTCRITSL